MNEEIRESGHEARGKKHQRSFTLIELLVVVAIILILAGLTIKVMSMVNRKTGQVATMRILEQVKNALGAYYTTYGSYPPVNSVYYEYENTPMSSLPAIPSDPHYTTGLVYYIYTGTFHNADAEVAQWQHYLEGIGSGGSPPYSNQIGAAFLVFWTNSSHTINDAWGRQLVYQHSSDYQSFILFSLGPDGVTNWGGGDDIGVTSED
jgi:prepilin-type N-terminal cleavage/methylation domain-containing protein